MTEHGHNFIREIAEAYRALEAESGLHGQIELMAKERIRDGETIARLEMRVMELKTLLDDTQAIVRSVEAERDDAGFRLLESEDRLDAIRRAIGMPEAIADAVAKAMEKVEPVVEAKPEPDHVAVHAWHSDPVTPTDTSQPAPEPLEDTSASWAGVAGLHPDVRPKGQGQQAAHWTEPVDIVASGQSEADPTALPHGGSNEKPLTAPIEDAGSVEDAVWQPEVNKAAE
jgi:hypothetical protein